MAAIAARGPRGVPARRRARLRRGLCRRARDRPRREHYLVGSVHRQPDRRHQEHQARHRHDQHAERASGGDRLADRDARPHARRPLHLRHQPRRSPLRRRGVRQSRCRPQRHVRRGDRRGAEDLGERAALQHPRQILDHQDRAAGDAGDRPGLFAEAAAAAASADRGHRGRAILQGRDRSGGARLGPDLGQLPDAEMGSRATGQNMSRAAPAPAARPIRRTGASPNRSSSPTTTKPRRLMPPIRTARTATITASSSPSSGAAVSTCSRPAGTSPTAR